MVEYSRPVSHYTYSPRVALCIMLLCQESTKPSLSLLLCCGRFHCLVLWSSNTKESWRKNLVVACLSSGACNQFLSVMCLLQPVNWTRSSPLHLLWALGSKKRRGLRSQVYGASWWDSRLCPEAIEWLNKKEGLVPRPLVIGIWFWEYVITENGVWTKRGCYTTYVWW